MNTMAQASSETKSRVYRGSWRTFLFRFSTFLVQLVLVAVSFGLFWGARSLAESGGVLFGFLQILAGGLFIFATLATIYQFFQAWVRHFGTYIKTSPGGIEYRNWPYYGITCEWISIERIEVQKKYGFNIEVLVPAKVQYVGKGTFFGLSLRKNLGVKEQTYIPLSGFTGWPDGKLAQDIKKYAGHIFEAK
jgi:hypothetical protein